MALRATRDTYGFENVGSLEHPIAVRRRVMAGQPVPEHWEVDKDAVESVAGVVGGYEPHQIKQRKARPELKPEPQAAPVGVVHKAKSGGAAA